MQRQIILDTETTGLSPELGHRILEIGCVEIVDRKLTRRHYHQYINPQREIDDGALEVHGITQEFLKDKPVFKDIFNPFLEYVKGAELIIHNAPFDVGFLNMELGKIGLGKINTFCNQITDSLKFAKDLRPGQRNSLDALCKAFDVDNSSRSLHGALLDAQLLGEVFIQMTRGQEAFVINFEEEVSQEKLSPINHDDLIVTQASKDELDAHNKYLKTINCKKLW